jgi:hypothetical protein
MKNNNFVNALVVFGHAFMVLRAILMAVGVSVKDGIKRTILGI